MKKKMKIWISCVLILSLLVLMVGCGNKPDSKKELMDKIDKSTMNNAADSTEESQDIKEADNLFEKSSSLF